MSSRPQAHTSAGAAVTELILAVFRANGLLLEAGNRLVSDLGLTSARWQVLGAIALAGTPLPVAHIARNMGLTRQAVQRVVNELEIDGLISFAPNPYHRRAKLVVLTEVGRHAYQAADERQKAWVNELANRLNEEDLTLATHVARTLFLRLEATEAHLPGATPGGDVPVTRERRASA